MAGQTGATSVLELQALVELVEISSGVIGWIGRADGMAGRAGDRRRPACVVGYAGLDSGCRVAVTDHRVLGLRSGIGGGDHGAVSDLGGERGSHEDSKDDAKGAEAWGHEDSDADMMQSGGGVTLTWINSTNRGFPHRQD